MSSDDVFKTDTFKTSSRRLQKVFKTSSTPLQDLLQRYPQDVFKTYHYVKLLTSLVNMSSRSIAKRVLYKRICLVHTSEKFMVRVQNLQE